MNRTFAHGPSVLLAASLMMFASAGHAEQDLDSCAPEGEAPRGADHHLHIRSSAGAEAAGMLGGDPVADQAPMTAADAVTALDAAGLGRGLVLSIAYMFGNSAVTVDDERGSVRAENEYVASEVAKAPSRLVGACSASPLADYVLEEIRLCADDERIGAFKLHLANADIDLENPEHVTKLRTVFEALERHQLPVVVHVRTHEAYGAHHARIFIDEVLAAAPSLSIQIAHMGGWGGYDLGTDEALGAFASALTDGRLAPARITFDLGAVVFDPRVAGDDEELARSVREANERLAARIREMGTDQVVFATDWPSWPPVREPSERIRLNVQLLREALPLKPDELDHVLENTNGLVCPPSQG